MPELDEHTVIDGRYRILNHIGSGGMADVYCAEDVHLGRRVALKLLYRRFAQDTEFVERFRREASAAAGLQHPNVVSVYDRGEFDGTYYIAMEFCQGVSLKELIARDAPFEPGRAIRIARQMLVAARFAHRRGVVHRDLKPQNVIIDSEESDENFNVKVADFGIAKAGSSEITEVGAIMGTAQYLSPEQAQGKPVTGASDLYSIGIVLYEMLTGRPPFDGDSAVAIALKHVSKPPPAPRELRPQIPRSLEAVVLKALAKEPADRYAEADSFLRELEAAEAELSLDEGGSTASFVPVGVAEPAAAAATAAAAPVAVEAPPEAPADVPPPDGPPGEPPRRGRNLLLGLLGVAALVGIVLLALLLGRADQKPVPLVLGKTLDSARTELEAAGFKVDIDRRSDLAPVDTVFRQVPSANAKVDEGSTVTLFVSNGPTTVKMPDVLGLTEQDARRRVRHVGLRPSLEQENSRKAPEGNVIRTDPGPGKAIERGSRVTLVVSSGPKEVAVPDVKGQDQKDAVDRLREEGLSVVVRERESGEPVDTVVDQTPAAGQLVGEGSTVTLYVSNGRLKEVPDVVGLDQGEAESDLRSAGFRASVRTTPTDQPDEDGRVLSQTPAAGKDRRSGATVVITVGTFTAPDATPAPGASP
jgi:eukaryotic-like serine/threonine-protein kinase